MRSSISGALGCAITVPVKKIPEETSTDTFCEPENAWFVAACKVLIQKDAGLALHLLTHWDERACYRYAAGDSKSPSNFYRRLLHSPQGWQWLCGIMEGCEDEWWGRLKRAYHADK